jgi:hypothetical protein
MVFLGSRAELNGFGTHFGRMKIGSSGFKDGVSTTAILHYGGIGIRSLPLDEIGETTGLV